VILTEDRSESVVELVDRAAEIPVSEVEAERSNLPEKLLTLDTSMVEVPVDPRGKFKVTGDAIIVKSG